MKAAVCCPGNSLLYRWPGDYAYAGVWAVNRALLVVAADWLSAGDPTLFNDNLLQNKYPRMGVITMADTIPQVRHLDGWGGLEWTAWEKSRHFNEHKIGRPVNWSVQAALLHACDLGATHIDLYGCDSIHTKTREDCTGYLGQDRTLERWKREEEVVIIYIDIHIYVI